jgi:HEAT repeat protein
VASLPRRKHWRRFWWSSLLLSACGCATYWDDVTDRNAHFKEAFFWNKPDPLAVLRDSDSGSKRGKALGELAEPAQRGGKPEEQELYIKILTTTARDDRDPYCRMKAIGALGGYKDPRAARALEDVYQQRLPFTPDMNNVIRQLAITSMAETKNPDSRALLVRIARSPSGPLESSVVDRQQTQDERLAAIRGLAKYSQPDSIDALVYIMETEKDVALHDRAYESAKEATGRNLPDDPKAWRAMLQNPNAVPPEPNVLERVMFWNTKPSSQQTNK